MAVLNEATRAQIWRGTMRYLSAQIATVSGIDKAALRAAVDAADDWADANAASYNAALPATFRNNASASQKALLLALVVLARYSVPALRQLIGEVD